MAGRTYNPQPPGTPSLDPKAKEKEPGDRRKKRQEAGQERRAAERKPGSLLISLAALGIVFGDIGTSPLYALRECFHGKNPVDPDVPNVLGILSLIFWSLTLVVTAKYLLFIMRLDNDGEGGILALIALLGGDGKHRARMKRYLVLVGIFGAALLYGDGIITPAISVLSAVEGLTTATKAFTPFLLPITVAILGLLFAFQPKGTEHIGSVFGPIMLLWFTVIALLGVKGILLHPGVLAAVSPVYGISFFLNHGWAGFLTLGGVVLAVTGAEALYADMGHFGKSPIRLAWFAVAFPALLLNYFGQGAMLLGGSDGAQPFYALAPEWALYPLVILATVATIIASQAIISGTFSLTRQAVLLGNLPQVRIIQTSRKEMGQIYVPSVNWLLMIATIGIVLGFRSSSNLAGAYGVAVTGTMMITTALAFVVAQRVLKWSLWVSALVCGAFLLIDLSFFGANIIKVVDGGWLPLAVAALVFMLFATWRRGREIISERYSGRLPKLGEFLKNLEKDPPVRVEGVGVFMTRHRYEVPPILLHHLSFNRALPKTVVLMTLVGEPVPRVAADRMVEITSFSLGVHRVIVHYGYIQKPNVPAALTRCPELKVDPDKATYYIQRQTFLPSRGKDRMVGWRQYLFKFMANNASTSADFFAIPPERVLELGIEVEL